MWGGEAILYDFLSILYRTVSNTIVCVYISTGTERTGTKTSSTGATGYTIYFNFSTKTSSNLAVNCTVYCTPLYTVQCTVVRVLLCFPCFSFSFPILQNHKRLLIIILALAVDYWKPPRSNTKLCKVGKVLPQYRLKVALCCDILCTVLNLFSVNISFH